jgi:hypothetical protein
MFTPPPSKELWQIEAERVGGAALVEVLSQMRATQVDIVVRLENIEKREGRLDALLEKIVHSFPDGDMESHRRYHQSIIEWRELRNKIVREALIKAAGTSAIGGGVWLLYAIWQAFKLSVKQ